MTAVKALRSLGTVVRDRLTGRPRPRMLTYTVTFKCNARCVMCDSWRIRSADDLELDEIRAIFRQLPALDVVRLTGGEPFVRRELPEIAELVREHLDPAVLHVTTNGFLPDDIVRFCEERDRRTRLELLVSVDGAEEKQVAVRGRPYAWSAAIETVRRLGPRQKELGLHLAVNQTIIDREGLEHYRRLREELRPLGVANHMVLAYDQSATYSVERDVDLAPTEVGEYTTFGDIPEGELRELLDAVEEDLSELPTLERFGKRYYTEGLRQRVLEEGGRVLQPPCTALHHHLRLFPNGDVPTCQFNSKVVGNLRRDDFETVWEGVLAGEQRRWVRACKGCWAECEVLPSAVYSGDLLLRRRKERAVL